MLPFFKITKTYITSKSLSEILHQLNAVVDSNRNTGKYSMNGERLSNNPPVFKFRSNSPLSTFGTPESIETSVIVHATVENDYTVLRANTKSNWLFPFFFWVMFIASAFQLLVSKRAEDIKIIFTYYVLMLLCIFLDKFFKGLMFHYLERDLSL